MIFLKGDARRLQLVAVAGHSLNNTDGIITIVMPSVKRAPVLLSKRLCYGNPDLQLVHQRPVWGPTPADVHYGSSDWFTVKSINCNLVG